MTDPTPVVDVAKVRADWAETLTPWTYPGEGNEGKTWGPYGDDIAGWAMDNVPALLNALDAANAKLAEIEALAAGADRDDHRLHCAEPMGGPCECWAADIPAIIRRQA